jgi:two-component system sensor kinase FixL
VALSDRVITALSDFAKLPFPDVRSVPVAPAVAEALEMTPLPRAIKLTTSIPPDLPPLLADADQLRIVLTNLIRNARDAMPQGGELAISASTCDGHIDVAIADTGVGIPAEALARIMEPLYSTKARGLGLGLAITRAIIEKHHGRLLVTSEPGRGSVFTVRLPASFGSAT